MIRSIHFACLALVMACAACSETTRESTAPNGPQSPLAGQLESGNGLWSQLKEARRRKENRVEAMATRRELWERGARTVSEDWRRKMGAWWVHFVEVDPSWLDSRVEWYALGPRANRILVENLIIHMVQAYDIGNGIQYRRAQSELFEIPEYSAPYLINGLAQSQGDDVIRQHCVDMLGKLGKTALAAVNEAYRAANDRGRLYLVRAVNRMAIPEAVPFLIKVIGDEEDFRHRITAIEGLGKAGDERAVPVLVNCLADDDVSVRKFAAGTLGAFPGAREAIGPLVKCMSRAARNIRGENGELDVVQNCRRSLMRISGRRFTAVRDWEAWWQRNRKG